MAKKKSGKKDKDAKKARAELKNKKNEVKAQSKDKKKLLKNKDDEDLDDLDIEEVLSNFKKQQEQFEKIEITSVTRPSPTRLNPCLLSNPLHNKKELLLFGGESISPMTGTANFHNELFSFSPDNNSWKKYKSQNSPMPRSSAAMASHSSGIALLHGGEFSSPKQSTFYHYSDTWILDTTTKEWSKMEKKNSPNARSGHRIITWKNFFILFGGFRDLGHSTTYLNDLWVFDITTYKWKQIEFPKNHTLPDPRSGHSFIPTSEGGILYGGYCKVKAKKGLQKGKILTDCWYLKMKSDLDGIRWEIRKKQGFQPSPRVGCSMAHHKGRGILFGGVYDFEETEESLNSIFYNDLFNYNIETNRWYALNLRKSNQSNQNFQRIKSYTNVSQEKEKELQDLLNSILKKNNLTDDDDDDNENQDTESNAGLNEMDIEDEIQDSTGTVTTSSQLPHPRFNSTTTVVDDSLFIYGGVWELGEKDFNIDSFYSIDLNKVDGVSVYWENLDDVETAKKLGEQDSDDESDEEEDDESDDDNDEEIEDTKVEAEDECEEEEEIDDTIDEVEIPDERPWLPHPKPFETLRAFYIREGPKFLEWAISNNRHAKGKHLKKKSFDLCEDRWWERRDQVRIEEDKLEELGVSGDIIEKDLSKPTVKRR